MEGVLEAISLEEELTDLWSPGVAEGDGDVGNGVGVITAGEEEKESERGTTAAKVGQKGGRGGRRRRGDGEGSIGEERDGRGGGVEEEGRELGRWRWDELGSGEDGTDGPELPPLLREVHTPAAPDALAHTSTFAFKKHTY